MPTLFLFVSPMSRSGFPESPESVGLSSIMKSGSLKLRAVPGIPKLIRLGFRNFSRDSASVLQRSSRIEFVRLVVASAVLVFLKIVKSICSLRGWRFGGVCAPVTASTAVDRDQLNAHATGGGSRVDVAGDGAALRREDRSDGQWGEFALATLGRFRSRSGSASDSLVVSLPVMASSVGSLVSQRILVEPVHFELIYGPNRCSPFPQRRLLTISSLSQFRPNSNVR